VKATLRNRLLVAFILVVVPPLVILALTATTLVSRGFEEDGAQRLTSGLRVAQNRIEALRGRAAEQVRAVAHDDLAALLPREEGDRSLAESIAARRDLQALEIVDGRGRVVSSSHWPAGVGLPDRDAVFPGDDALRLEQVADGYGVAERLALMPSLPADWRGGRVTVRGGPFLDASFTAELSSLMGVDVALRDGLRGRWIAEAASPLSQWSGVQLGGDATRGDVQIGGATFLWAAAPLRRGVPLWVVVATPRTPLDRVVSRVLRLTLGIGAVALLGALVAAAALSGRIARPIRKLSEGARRVAAGDFDSAVAVGPDDEIGDLGRAFNSMTAELARSRDRLLQAERVAAWREMARRLAHELKNPLFPIQLSIETLRRAHAEGREFDGLFRESSDTILEELRSLRKIIDEFSEFARMPQPVLEPTDLNAVVEQTLALYQAQANGCRVEAALGQDLPTLAADRVLLGRAIGNLIANALEAMPGGGALRVRTSRRPGGLCVEVEDTGPGLTEEQRTRLFTPYFTTKKGGTGLGLSIVQGIVTDHGGRIEVRSEPGQGTTFTLILPVAAS
jgi:nitrogen fixation/metabolism regulation signal transduction histidine kinase